MKKGLYLAMFLLTSCGGFRLFEQAPQKEREIASLTLEHLLAEEESQAAEIEEKLHSLHCYYVLGQKKLDDFDASLHEKDLQELYQSSSYLGLLAIRTQVDEIEAELIQFGSKIKDKKALTDRILNYAKRSEWSRRSMENLAFALEIPMPLKLSRRNPPDINQELASLETNKEFQVYDKNIEHLSHLMDVKMKGDTKKFHPSLHDAGNVTGQEFPSKVWALSFSKGPHKTVTKHILRDLKDFNLKATFFQVAERHEVNPAHGKLLLDAGMELGGQSFTHKELSKVGGLTLQKEITGSVLQMEKNLNADLKLFRLPYGSGVDVPTIRKLMAQNSLIHVTWNVDTLDWMAQSPDRIIKRAKALMKKTDKGGGIILFHDVHLRTVSASREIMTFLGEGGRRVCTVGEIISDMNEGSGKVCSTN